ncbi:MAG: carbohydrate kinase family protein [Chloroflexota bacterium]
MIELVGLGRNCVDYRARVPKVVNFDEDNGRLTDLRLSFGGPATIAMVTAQRLGAHTSIIGPLGEDEYGRMVLDFLKREGVASDLMRMSPEDKTQIAIILLDEKDGRRAIMARLGGDTATGGLTDADRERIARAKVLHLDGGMMPLAQEAARWARQNGVVVTVDANGLHPGLDTLFELSDYLVTSGRFAQLFFPGDDYDRAAKRFMEMGPSVVALTFGEEGSRTWTRNGDFYRPAFKVRALDTCGAGDVFHGAYAYGLARGWDLTYVTDFASACAAMKSANIEDYLGIPRLPELQAFLAAHGIKNPD